MAKYTQTIKEYCESVYLAQQLSINPDAKPWNVITSMDDSDYYRIVSDYVFPTDWPFYNDTAADKKEFVEEWTDKFLYHEIGQDSMGRFRHVLKAWLRTNMIYFARLYSSDIASVADVINNIDVWTTRTGELSKKTGSLSRSGSKNSIVALGTAATERELSQTAESGQEVSAASGTDTNGYTDTYNNLTDAQNVTEHRAGKDGSDVAAAVERFRALILDLNSQIFDKMQADGLFMLVW